MPEAGTVLYEADTSGGLDQWAATAGWKHFQGMLVNDGSGGEVNAPYIPSVPDYAIEVEIQVPELGVWVGNGFGLHARDGDAVAKIEVGGCCPSERAYLVIEQLPIVEGVFDPGIDWHIYRLEVQGNAMKLLVDGTLVIEASDNRLISESGGSVGVFALGTQPSIRSFRVIAL